MRPYILLLAAMVSGCSPLLFNPNPAMYNYYNSPAYQMEQQRQHQAYMAQEQRIHEAQQALGTWSQNRPIYQSTPIKQIDMKCQSDCFSQGYMFQYCQQACSY